MVAFSPARARNRCEYRRDDRVVCVQFLNGINHFSGYLDVVSRTELNVPRDSFEDLFTFEWMTLPMGLDTPPKMPVSPRGIAIRLMGLKSATIHRQKCGVSGRFFWRKLNGGRQQDRTKIY
jgi:hypothetical protein